MKDNKSEIDWNQYRETQPAKRGAIDWSQYAEKPSTMPARTKGGSYLDLLERTMSNNEMKDEEGINPLHAASIKFNQSFANYPEGIMQALFEATGANKLNEGLRQARAIDKAAVAEAEQQQPTASFVGGLLGETGAGLLTGGGIGGKNLTQGANKLAPSIEKGIHAVSPWLGKNGFGKYLTNILKGAEGGLKIGGLGGLIRYREEGESRLGNALGEGLTGGAFGGAIPGITIPAIKTAKFGWDVGKNAGKSAKKEFLKAIGDRETIFEDLVGVLTDEQIAKTLERAKTAKELGIPLTLGESSGHPLIGEMEGALSFKPARNELYNFKDQARTAQNNAIDELLEIVHPTGRSGKPEYARAARQRISNKKFNEIMENENTRSAYQFAKNADTYKPRLRESIGHMEEVVDFKVDQLKKAFERGAKEGKKVDLSIKKLDELENQIKQFKSSVNETSTSKPLLAIDKKLGSLATKHKVDLGEFNPKNLAVLDITKRRLAKLQKAAERNAPLEGLGDSSALGEARSSLNKELKSVSPDYKAGTKIEQEKILRRNIEENRTRPHTYATRNFGSDFYQGVLGPDKKFEKLTKGLNPQALQRATDLRNVLKGIVNAESYKTATGKSSNSMNMPRSAGQWVVNAVRNHIFEGKHDSMVVKIITDPNWAQELEKYGAKRADKLLAQIGKQKPQSVNEFNKIFNKLSPSEKTAISASVLMNSFRDREPKDDSYGD